VWAGFPIAHSGNGQTLQALYILVLYWQEPWQSRCRVRSRAVDVFFHVDLGVTTCGPRIHFGLHRARHIWGCVISSFDVSSLIHLLPPHALLLPLCFFLIGQLVFGLCVCVSICVCVFILFIGVSWFVWCRPSAPMLLNFAT